MTRVYPRFVGRVNPGGRTVGLFQRSDRADLGCPPHYVAASRRKPKADVTSLARSLSRGPYRCKSPGKSAPKEDRRGDASAAGASRFGRGVPPPRLAPTPLTRPALPAQGPVMVLREAFAKRRCLVPAPVYYEWRDDPEGKTRLAVASVDGEPVAFAGICETWKSPGGERAAHLRHHHHRGQHAACINSGPHAGDRRTRRLAALAWRG